MCSLCETGRLLIQRSTCQSQPSLEHCRLPTRSIAWWDMGHTMPPTAMPWCKPCDGLGLSALHNHPRMKAFSETEQHKRSV